MRDLRVWWICLVLLPWGAFGQAGPAGDALKSAREAYSQGHYDEAESQYLNAEKEAESGGPNEARLARVLNNLGVLYQREAKYDEAEQALRRALVIWQKQADPQPLELATTLNNLASLYTYRSRYSEAEPLYRQCLALREKSLGPENAQVASALNNLGEFYWEQDKLAEAEPLYRRAVFIKEKTLGPADPGLAASLNPNS